MIKLTVIKVTTMEAMTTNHKIPPCMIQTVLVSIWIHPEWSLRTSLRISESLTSACHRNLQLIYLTLCRQFGQFDYSQPAVPTSGDYSAYDYRNDASYMQPPTSQSFAGSIMTPGPASSYSSPGDPDNFDDEPPLLEGGSPKCDHLWGDRYSWLLCRHNSHTFEWVIDYDDRERVPYVMYHSHKVLSAQHYDYEAISPPIWRKNHAVMLNHGQLKDFLSWYKGKWIWIFLFVLWFLSELGINFHHIREKVSIFCLALLQYTVWHCDHTRISCICPHITFVCSEPLQSEKFYIPTFYEHQTSTQILENYKCYLISLSECLHCLNNFQGAGGAQINEGSLNFTAVTHWTSILWHMYA